MGKLGAGFVVVDIWRVKPGKEEEIKPVLADAWHRFSGRPEILSVDYALVDGDPSRYLVVFRYRDEQAREDFVSSGDLQSTMSRLMELWDLDDVFVKGTAVED